MRARIEERTPFPWAVKEPLLKETDGKCAHCGVPLDRYTNLTVEHVIPLNRGGTNDPDNLTVLCDDCNLEKSDMILPVTWYPYLQPKKKKELTKLLVNYIADVDYLSEDCLMPVDTFRIEVPITTKKVTGRGTKILRMPAYITGIRMARDDAFKWLMDYKRSLLYRDSAGTLSHPADWQAPCYLLKKGDIEVAMVNPWMIHKWDEELKNYRNEILMDWFFKPDLPERDYLPEMLSYLVGGVELYIASSIAGTMPTGACAVLFRIRCFLSDRFCNPVLDLLAKDRSDDISEWTPKGAHMTARIRELTVFHLIGDPKSCKALREKMDAESPDGLLTMEEAMKENEHLNKRFARE